MDLKRSADISVHDNSTISGIVKAGQGIVLDLGGPIMEPLTASEDSALPTTRLQ